MSIYWLAPRNLKLTARFDFDNDFDSDTDDHVSSV